MPAEKITGMVVGLRPYRESSALVTVLSECEGLLCGVAKGIKKQKPAGLFLERGFLLEGLVYRKPHRDLHLLSNIAVTDFFETIRLDLRKSTIRDAALETVAAHVSREASIPELFSQLLDFCRELPAAATAAAECALLWKFYHDFAWHLGFGPDLGRCRRCGALIEEAEGCCLVVAEGNSRCMRCRTVSQMTGYLPAMALRALAGRPGADGVLSDKSELRRITDLWGEYCRYHCGSNYEYKSLSFLYTIL
jgi:DNA repair protein RecO